MHFAFGPEDTAFADAAGSWLRAHAPAGPAPHGGQQAREHTLRWLQALHAGGWSGIAWPEQYGGLGLSPERQMLWYEQYVASGAPSVLGPGFVGLNHAGPTLMARGSEAQKAFHLPRILAGQVLWCQGFSEPEAGSDLASLRTTGRVEGDHLVINGQKTWSSWADIADYQELLVRTDPGAQRHKGLSWVICDMHTPGITVRPIENMAGAIHFADIFYDDVRIPLDQVVGGLGSGWDVAMTTLGFERNTAAAALQLELGVKADRLVAWAEQQPPGQQRLGLRHALAEVRAEAAALRALTYRTAFRDPDTPFDGSIVRLCFAELSQKLHSLAMELLGPAALEAQQPGQWVHHYLEAYSETIAGGTAEIQRNIIGERILGLPRAPAR
jgi:alkylation response protein AidB-like acyl-CoA dehydrogenase